ncbi:hypothetical protein O1L60_37670 [Streptomyces diastatochromogenes]|nr:hypothetical protein [Streptomyces diastatochromogenes]
MEFEPSEAFRQRAQDDPLDDLGDGRDLPEVLLVTGPDPADPGSGGGHHHEHDLAGEELAGGGRRPGRTEQDPDDHGEQPDADGPAHAPGDGGERGHGDQEPVETLPVRGDQIGDDGQDQDQERQGAPQVELGARRRAGRAAGTGCGHLMIVRTAAGRARVPWAPGVSPPVPRPGRASAAGSARAASAASAGRAAPRRHEAALRYEREEERRGGDAERRPHVHHGLLEPSGDPCVGLGARCTTTDVAVTINVTNPAPMSPEATPTEPAPAVASSRENPSTPSVNSAAPPSRSASDRSGAGATGRTARRSP